MCRVDAPMCAHIAALLACREKSHDGAILRSDAEAWAGKSISGNRGGIEAAARGLGRSRLSRSLPEPRAARHHAVASDLARRGLARALAGEWPPPRRADGR